jgi:hypothetical protein
MKTYLLRAPKSVEPQSVCPVTAATAHKGLARPAHSHFTEKHLTENA